MNILNLATTDEGGAGVACINFNNLFLEKGHNSVLLVKESSLSNNNVIVLRKPASRGSLRFYWIKVRDKFFRLYRKIDPLETDSNYSFYNLNERKKHYSARKILAKTPFKPDLIFVFWVSEFINTKGMNDLARLSGAKILLLMTDNAPLTGGCHYPWACKGFESDCSNCPAILTKSKKIIAQRNLAFKKKNIHPAMELMSSSVSDYQRAASSALFKGKKIHKIVAPIDPVLFAPGDKKAAKLHFGLDPKKKVIFYGASSFIYPRKGGQYFVDAMAILKKTLKDRENTSNFMILIAGTEGEQYFRNLNVLVKEVGYLTQNELIRAYQAADFLVSPSLEDSGPMMINQCIMCGTPIVAFNIGVAMDLVRTGETGYIAELFDTADLAEGMRYLLSLSENELDVLSANCRNYALKNFTTDIYYKKIVALF